jgi:uncharacterized protein (DUF58 family)
VAATNHHGLLDPAALARLGRLTICARRPMIGSVTGVHRSATRGSSVEFAEYRKYVPGDDLRRLDWRVYARTDRFYMKEFDADTNLRCMLFLDLSGSMAFKGAHGSKIACARRLAATLAYLLIRQGDAAGLWLAGPDGDREIPARRSPSHVRLLLDTIQSASPKGPVDLCAALHRAADKIRRRALVVVVSDFFADPDELLRAFQHMRFQRHDLALFHLLDPQELHFEFDRPIRFADLESAHHVVSDPALMAREYRREVQTYLDALQRGSHEFHADYRRVLLDSGYEKALASFILQRQRGGTG